MLFGSKPVGTISYMGGVPALYEDFVWSWTQLIQYSNEFLCEPGEYIHYTRSKVSYHSFARNSLVDNMQGDWLLMLDTDHMFEPDLAVRLLAVFERYNLDVLTGLYQYKEQPHLPVLYYWNQEHQFYEVLSYWEGDPEIFEIGSAGGGCLLIRNTVFKRIREELNELPFDIIPPWSEDHSFFARCRKLGIKAFCCPAIESPHISLRPVKREDFDRKKVVSVKRPSVEGYKWQ